MEFYLFNEDYYLEKGAFKLDFIISCIRIISSWWLGDVFHFLACSILVVAIGIERFIYYKRTCGDK